MRQQLEKDGSQVFEIGSRTSSLASVCEGIVALWGPRCEAILHDFSDLEHSVVHVSGNITGRAIGAPLTDLGLQVLTSASHDQDVLVYHSKTPNGALLKSVSILIRERPRGRIMGALCINVEIEHLQRVREIIGELVSVPTNGAAPEHFANSPREVIQTAISEMLDERGWIIRDLVREQRQELIGGLDERGAFAFRSAPSIVADLLGVSRFTVYKDLKLYKDLKQTH